MNECRPPLIDSAEMFLNLVSGDPSASNFTLIECIWEMPRHHINEPTLCAKLVSLAMQQPCSKILDYARVNAAPRFPLSYRLLKALREVVKSWIRPENCDAHASIDATRRKYDVEYVVGKTARARR